MDPAKLAIGALVVVAASISLRLLTRGEEGRLGRRRLAIVVIVKVPLAVPADTGLG